LYGWADGQNLGEELNSYQKNLFHYNSPQSRATEEIKKKWDIALKKEKIQKYGSWANWLDYDRRQSADLVSTDRINWDIILDETDFFYEKILRLDPFQIYYIVTKGFPILPIYLLLYKREEFDNFNFIYFSELDFEDTFPYLCDIDVLIAEREEEAKKRAEWRKNYKNLDDEDD